MELSDMAAMQQVAGSAALLQQQLSMSMAKKAADSQMQMANMIAQQAQQAKSQYNFSVYA
jgi:hypothetical protein